ncbi:hypothetical protein N7512_007786 [Penicillium capsulatum]|nr:hypothetical protein N7512_007786 [Penicillium capsulatum]
MIRDLQRCKYLGKMIKSQRTPPWPTVPTTDLPPKELADTLVDIYLRTIESVYRTLHIPTFRRDYEAIWGVNTAPDMAFVIQIKLVMAIGASIYDDNFSLRALATRWVYEAQSWVSEPQFKRRLDVQFLQTNILLLLAREIVGVDGGLIWIAAGQLIRLATYMGFHRDPVYLPKRTTFICEMRRRIWNTVIEIALQTSMESGGPPLLGLEDFDTQPPGNLDDEQIMTEDPMPRSDETLTEMSIALALRRMFPLRLVIARVLNGIGAPTPYGEIIRIDEELRRLYKTTCRNFQAQNTGNTNTPSLFQTSLLDYLVRRYLMALHMPFFALALQETAYAFSRRVIVDTAMRIRYLIYPPSKISSFIPGDPMPTGQDLARLAKCGSAPFRTCSTQSCFLIASELKAQLQEEEGPGPVPLRQDLLSALDDAKGWALGCLEVGETNTKGYLFLSLVAMQIDGLRRGLAKDQIAELLAKTAEDAQARALVVMEEKAAEVQGTDMNLENMGGIPDESIPNLMGDWDFMVSLHYYLDNGTFPDDYRCRIHISISGTRIRLTGSILCCDLRRHGTPPNQG